jgi:hypothetical protein
MVSPPKADHLGIIEKLIWESRTAYYRLQPAKVVLTVVFIPASLIVDSVSRNGNTSMVSGHTASKMARAIRPSKSCGVIGVAGMGKLLRSAAGAKGYAGVQA